MAAEDSPSNTLEAQNGATVKVVDPSDKVQAAELPAGEDHVDRKEEQASTDAPSCETQPDEEDADGTSKAGETTDMPTADEEGSGDVERDAAAPAAKPLDVVPANDAKQTDADGAAARADPASVPRRGPFFMHDTRSGSARPPSGGRNESRGSRKVPSDRWVHDRYADINSDADLAKSGPSGQKDRKGRGSGKQASRRKQSAGGKARGGTSPASDGSRKKAGAAHARTPSKGSESPKQAPKKSSKLEQPGSSPKATGKRWGDDDYSSPLAEGAQSNGVASSPVKATSEESTSKPQRTGPKVVRIVYTGTIKGKKQRKQSASPAAKSQAAPQAKGKAQGRSGQGRGNGAGKNKAKSNTTGNARAANSPMKSPKSMSRKEVPAFVPSPSAVAAAYQQAPPQVASAIMNSTQVPQMGMGMYMPVQGVPEQFVNSSVYFDQNGQPFYMPGPGNQRQAPMMGVPVHPVAYAGRQPGIPTVPVAGRGAGSPQNAALLPNQVVPFASAPYFPQPSSPGYTPASPGYQPASPGYPPRR